MMMKVTLHAVWTRTLVFAAIPTDHYTDKTQNQSGIKKKID